MACRDWAAKVGGGVLGRVWALVAALALLLGLAATAPAPAQAASFRDVPSGQWYTSWVDKASDQGLMSGFTDPATGGPTGYFGPDEPLTRAQVATVLWRMAGGPSSGRASFPDVERGSWYDAPVAWCVKAGVVTGYTSGPDKGHFRPDRPVTRQELATMVYRYAKYAGMDVADPDPSAFRSTTDWRTVDSWASEALTWTAAAGVLSGVDNRDGTYSVVPFGTATRAMAAKVSVVLSGSPSAAKASYTVTFNSNGGSAVKAQAVRSGAKASKPADPTKSGYLFKGWYSDKSLTKAYNFNSTVRSNLTLHAKWEKKAAYTVTFNANGGTAVKAQPVSSGAKASKPAAPTKAGHAFKGWYSDKSLTKAYDFGSVVRSDLTLYAKWEANEYTVTFVSNGGTSVSKQTVAYGAKASKPSDPTLDGSQFAGWYTDESLTKAYDFGSAVKSDLALYAKWTSQFYAVLYKDGLLSLQARADTDPSHGGVLGWWVWDGSSRPWYDMSAYVRSVVARDRAAVSNGDEMFRDLANCRSMDLSRLDVSGASDLSSMFDGCSSLTSLDVSGWDVSGASDLSDMFCGCSSLTSLDVSCWDVSGASDLSAMFLGCRSLASLDVSGWDVSGASNLSYMFYGCLSLASLDVSCWDVSNASYLSDMFLGCSSLTSLDVSCWDVSGASDLSAMFRDCSSLTSLDVSGWDVSGASGLHAMFRDCSSLTSLDVSGWDVSGASGLHSMFSGCSRLQSLDLSGWDVSDVSGASGLSWMFDGCSSLTSLDVSGWDVSGASRLSWMFRDCSSLTSLDVSGWDVSGASGLNGMFSGCPSLTSLDLSGWDVSNASYLSDMFDGCPSLGTVTLGAGCGPLVGELPRGPWYDAEGKEYDRPPAGVAGTFTKAKPATLAVAADGVPDAGASLPAQIVEGEQDGQRYVIVPEGAPFECGLEYPELAGRYVGPGVYVTGYVGDADSVTVPLEIDGAPVVSANLSWNESDRAGMTRLVAVTFERVEGKASSLAQLDVSGNGLSSLDIGGLDALVRLNCEGNPIADLAALQAWAAQDGHEAKLPQVQDAAPAEPGDAAAPSEPQESASPDVPTKPAEPANPEISSAEPEEPSDPAVPSVPEQPGSSDVSGELDQPGDDSVGSDMGESDEQEEPADTAGLGETGQDGDASASEEQAGAVELAEAGEGPLALAA